MVSWAGLKFIQSWKWDPQGRAGLGNRKFLPVSSWEWRWVRSQDLQVKLAPAGSCLRCDAALRTGVKREAGDAPSMCQSGHMEQRAGACTMLDPNSLLLLGGSSCHFHSGLVLLVWFRFVCLFLVYGFVFDCESPYLPWLNEETGFIPCFY